MRYHNITKDDMLNGDGLRVVLWVSGCPHKCEGCHNPITWDEKGGLPFDENAEKEIFEELANDYIDGITISGGDPLYHTNRKNIENLLEKIKTKFPKKTVWIYTGYLWNEIKDLNLLKYVDILVDGKFVLSLKDSTLHWKGSSNQNVIDVKESLKNNKIILHKES